MKKMRKYLCLALCLVMCLAIIPVSAYAAEQGRAPYLDDVWLTDSEVYVPDKVEVIVEATDDGEMYGAGLIFLDEETGIYIAVEAYGYYWDPVRLEMVAYDDGYLHGEIDMTKFMPAGTYKLVWVYLEDQSGRWREYDAYIEFADPGYAPMPEHLKSVKLVVHNDLNGWAEADGDWYYFREGVMLYSQWLEEDGKWYCIKEGYMVTGWETIDDNLYYLDDRTIL